MSRQGWRSVVISNPAQLNLNANALQVSQRIDGQDKQARVPIEDINVLVLDNPQVMLTSMLLSALMEAQVAVISVSSNHIPNGVMIPYLPHSRGNRVINAQINMTLPLRKRLWLQLLQEKIHNQAAVLAYFSDHSKVNDVVLTRKVVARLGEFASTLNKPHQYDEANTTEAHAAQLYFPALFPVLSELNQAFNRGQHRFYNAALNYGYAVVRAAIARTLVVFGFLPSLGVHHQNDQNAFNLADDVIEPYRPFVDAWVKHHFAVEPPSDYELSQQDKAKLVSLLGQDVRLTHHAQSGACSMLAAIEASVISLSNAVVGEDYLQGVRIKPELLSLPQFNSQLDNSFLS
jgi:CRISPR-associated protein Cas1